MTQQYHRMKAFLAVVVICCMIAVCTNVTAGYMLEVFWVLLVRGLVSMSINTQYTQKNRLHTPSQVDTHRAL